MKVAGHAFRAGLLRRGLAEEVVLLDGREAGVRVGAADHAELVGIHAELLFELQAVLAAPSGHTRIRASPASSARSRRDCPCPIARSWRTRRSAKGAGWVSPSPLIWRGLVEPLPLARVLRILPVHRLAGERFDDREHAAVAEVAVVGDGEHAAAGLLLVGGHPLPQVAWVVAAHRRLRRKRLDLARLRHRCRGR